MENGREPLLFHQLQNKTEKHATFANPSRRCFYARNVVFFVPGQRGLNGYKMVGFVTRQLTPVSTVLNRLR
jgi:hypothetical protein